MPGIDADRRADYDRIRDPFFPACHPGP